MSGWASGYVLDIEYTSGFYREISPSYLRYVTLTQGFRPPRIGAGTRYCELGCGQGVGTAIMAAANPEMEFWGLDFNPAQIANAQRLAAEANLQNVTFVDYSFDQAVNAAEGSIPQFDYIVLHGIYSWISVENRHFIVRFIDRYLKPGGLVYVSYNCMPGWAATAPLQRLIREHANRHPDRSDFQAEAGMKMLDRLKDAKAAYFAQNPAARTRMEKLPDQNRNYLAHEYLNGHWHAMYHLDVAKEMEAARLNYVGSATLAENIDALSVPADMVPVVQETRDRGWGETLRDYARNQVFRRDVFLRGASPMKALEQKERLTELHFALMVPRSQAKTKFQTPLGEAEGHKQIYLPILDALAERPHTAGELSALSSLKSQSFAAVVQAITILVHSGQIHSVSMDKTSHESQGRLLNLAIAKRLAIGENLNFISVPKAGTGMNASYAEFVALLALDEGMAMDAQKVAQYGWSIMERTGQRLIKDKATLKTKEDNLKEMESQLQLFFSEKLPVWQSLNVI